MKSFQLSSWWQSIQTFFRRTHVVLTLLFIGSVLFTCLILLFYVNESFRDDFLLVSAEKQQELSEKCISNIVLPWQALHNVGCVLTDILSAGDTHDYKAISHAMRSYVRHHKILRSITFLNFSGTTLNTLRVGQHAHLFWKRYDEASSNKNYVQHIKNTCVASQAFPHNAQSKGIWRFYDRADTLLFEEKLPYSAWAARTLRALREKSTRDTSPQLSLPSQGYLGGAVLRLYYPVCKNKDSATERCLGALLLAIDLSFLITQLNQFSFSSVETAFLVNAQGDIVAHARPEEGLSLSAHTLKYRNLNTLKKNWGKALERTRTQGISRYRDQDTQQVLQFFPLSASPQAPPFLRDIYLGLLFQNEQKNLGFFQSQREVIQLACLLIVLLSLFVMQVSSFLTRPLERISKVLNDIAHLKFDVEVKDTSYFYELNKILNVTQGLAQALRAFGRFAPRALVKQLIGERKEALLGGEEKRVTILFSDIEGFTSITEKMPPPELVSRLSEYFQECTSVIQDNKGTLDKYIGDSVMAFWGAPLPDPLHVIHGCQSALSCRNRLKQMNAQYEKQERPPFVTRFGLCTGVVNVGNFGSTERFQYTVLGDTVNLAARLEGLNKIYGTRILVDEEAYQHGKRHFSFRIVDKVAVKGKEQGVYVYELLASLDDTAPKSDNYLSELAMHMEQAFAFYQKREWARALKRYRFIFQSFHQDTVAALFIKRCTHFLTEPPPQDWDGITRLTTK